MIVLNAAVAEQLVAFKQETDALIDKGVKKDEAIFQTLRRYIIACKKSGLKVTDTVRNGKKKLKSGAYLSRAVVCVR